MSDTDLRKKIYTYSDIEGLARKFKFEYEKKLADQRDRILDLREQVKHLEGELDTYKSRSRHINKALIAAVAKAEELESAARQKYDMELKSLRLFHAKWLNYYKKIIAKYPIDDELLKAARFNDKMNQIFESEGAQFLDEVIVNELENARANYQAATGNIVAKSEQPTASEESNLYDDSGAEDVFDIFAGATGTKSEAIRTDSEIEQEALAAIKAAALSIKQEDEEELASEPDSTATPEEIFRAEQARLERLSGNNQQASNVGQANSSAVTKTKINSDSADDTPKHNMRRYYGDKNPDMMKEYMRSGTNGFSLEEALNPTQSLSELIKDVLGE